MYAIIQTGGKQYRVKQGDMLKVETLEYEVGSSVGFNNVLMLSDGENITCGAPYVNNAVVNATIIAHGRHKKIKIIKFRRRKHHMKQMGHRQNFTQIQITAIQH
jgi:large subunit ribosomal protein L21